MRVSDATDARDVISDVQDLAVRESMGHRVRSGLTLGALALARLGGSTQRRLGVYGVKK